MLTTNKTYHVSSDDNRSASNICLSKENGFYNFSITNFSGEKIDLKLNEVLVGELFTALKELGNFM